MKHEQITAALNKAGHTWGTASEAIGKTKTTLISVSQRKTTSRPVARALSLLIEIPVEEVFPDKPDYHGKGKKKRSDIVDSARAKLKKAGLAA